MVFGRPGHVGVLEVAKRVGESEEASECGLRLQSGPQARSPARGGTTLVVALCHIASTQGRSSGLEARPPGVLAELLPNFLTVTFTNLSTLPFPRRKPRDGTSFHLPDRRVLRASQHTGARWDPRHCLSGTREGLGFRPLHPGSPCVSGGNKAT